MIWKVKKVHNVPLVWGAALLIALLVGLAVVVLIAGRHIDRQAALLQKDSVPGLIGGHLIRSACVEGFVCAVQAMGADSAAERDSFLRRMGEWDAVADAACAGYVGTIHIDPRQDTANYEMLLRTRTEFLTTRAQFIGLVRGGRAEEARAFLQRQLTPAYETLKQACDVLVAYNNRTGTTISLGLLASIAQLRWIVVAVTVLAMLAGIGIGLNLVSRQHAEILLRQSESQFRSTMIKSAIGMAIIAPDHRVIEVNPAVCKLLGYTREELLAKSLLAITHPDDRAVGPENFRRIQAGEMDSYEREKRYVHKSGRVVWAQLTVSVVRDPAGQPIHLIAQIQDVTERKRTLEQLAELTERLGLALEIGRLGVWQYWPKTQQTIWDARMSEIFGLAQGAEPLTFNQFLERIHPEDRPVFREAWDRLFAGATELRHRFRVVAPEGGSRHIEARALMHRDPAGHPDWVLGVNIDLTDVVTATMKAERYREQLIQSQKLETLGHLAGGIVHDFNNLLTGINGFVELAAQTLPPRHQSIAMLDEAKRAAGSARDLVRRILLFSRQAPAGARKQMRLSEMVRETIPLISTLVPATISLRPELAAGEPLILADPGQIQQILMNLCGNASQAIGEGTGTLTITVDTCLAPRVASVVADDGQRVRLRVADTGCGMSPETLRRVFEPFFTTKKAGEGTGLGLAIVQGIIQEHGGTIAIESAVGHGTVFTMLFPVCETVALPETPSRSEPEAGGGTGAILVVDDEPTVVTLASAVLARAGYSVVACTTVPAALRELHAERGRFNLVLTDYNMPEMNGLEFIRQARDLAPDLSFLIMTGSLLQFSLIEGHGVRVISKPFESAELLIAIRDQLNRTQDTRSSRVAGADGKS